MGIRLRVPELLAEHGMTAYGLHKASGGRISLSGAYRLAQGEFREVSAEMLDALCEVFGINDPGPLLVREKGARRERGTGASASRGKRKRQE
jgi:DNA-binding Xre family transcriptional regulator